MISIEEFVARWKASTGGSEQANSQLFLTELCSRSFLRKTEGSFRHNRAAEVYRGHDQQVRDRASFGPHRHDSTGSDGKVSSHAFLPCYQCDDGAILNANPFRMANDCMENSLQRRGLNRSDVLLQRLFARDVAAWQPGKSIVYCARMCFQKMEQFVVADVLMLLQNQTPEHRLCEHPFPTCILLFIHPEIGRNHVYQFRC